MANAGFTPLQDFWSDFFELTARSAPPPRTPERLEDFLHTVFGNLVEHRCGSLDQLPFRLTCSNCKNNISGRPREAVCRTHAGVVKGVLQAMTHVPLSVAYHPGVAGACSMTINVTTGPEGEPLLCFAKCLDNFDLFSYGSSFWLTNRNDGTNVHLTRNTFDVLSVLSKERTPHQISEMTALDEEAVRTILDQCYSLNLVQCRFASKSVE